MGVNKQALNPIEPFILLRTRNTQILPSPQILSTARKARLVGKKMKQTYPF